MEKNQILAETEPEIVELTAVLKAMAEPNRMCIFAELMEGDSCNCELQERLELAPNLLSHHFRVLEKAGLVHSRRDQVNGRWIYYSVDRTAARWHAWFNQFLGPSRIQQRTLCGPEGQLISSDQISVKF
jgi:ArsR family transcriptional regulator